jgi:soluble lytic murein transglycosylase-like protein
MNTKTDPIASAYEEQLLQEGKIKNALFAATVATSLATSISHFQKPENEAIITPNRVTSGKIEQKPQSKRQELHAATVAAVKSKYKINDELANRVVKSAYDNERETFPKAKDILAISGIESSFNPNAKSSLKKDPAVGLMQVRLKVWNLPPEKLADVEGQIQHGAAILHSYYNRLGSEKDAVHAYNVGITNFKKGKGLNPSYVEKYTKEKKNLYSHLPNSLDGD